MFMLFKFSCSSAQKHENGLNGEISLLGSDKIMSFMLWVIFT
uniref:Uncharacterized protein n=1 Tax=Arundo donax TaxID=35708 RepID=A0A0A9BIK6_ARUDO